MARRTTTQTAHDSYTSRMADVRSLQRDLQSALKLHRENEAIDKKNWGYAGDLAEARNKLVELVAFLTGCESEEIRDGLTND